MTGNAGFVMRSGYEACVRVRFSECDPNGHVNNAVYLSYLEQVAIDHSAAAGWTADRLRDELGAVWLARRHEIEFWRPAVVGDVLLLRTWPVAMSGARATRAYSIHRLSADARDMRPDRLVDGAAFDDRPASDLLVRAETEWAFVDIRRQRPIRVPAHLAEDFIVPG